jgi:hypothetical protein
MSCNKRATVGGDANSGGGCASMRPPETWEFSLLPAQFCCEPKISLKNNLLIF